MRYKVSEIEDQIIATLQADTTNFASIMVASHTGQVSAQMFFNPEYMQDVVKRLPFALVTYQGRTSSKSDRDSSGKIYIHTLMWRIYVGASNLRGTKEGARGCYDILAAIFDDLHGKVPVTSSPQQLPGYTPLSGTALTSTGHTILGPFFEAGGSDEQLVVNIPGVVVYRTDYSVRLVA